MNKPGGYQPPTKFMLQNIGHVRHPADHGRTLFHVVNRPGLMANITGTSTTMEGSPSNTLNQWG